MLLRKAEILFVQVVLRRQSGLFPKNGTHGFKIHVDGRAILSGLEEIISVFLEYIAPNERHLPVRIRLSHATEDFFARRSVSLPELWDHGKLGALVGGHI